MMRAFTVRQPWGTAIAHLGKPVENRTRNIAGRYRGPVAIHTSKAKPDDLEYVAQAFATGLFDDVERGTGTLNGHPLLQGYVIAVADIVDVHHGPAHPETGCWRDADVLGWVPFNDDDWTARCSPWGMPEQHHIVLANPRPLVTPIPARGALSLWTLPADVEAAVREQVSA